MLKTFGHSRTLWNKTAAPQRLANSMISTFRHRATHTGTILSLRTTKDVCTHRSTMELNVHVLFGAAYKHGGSQFFSVAIIFDVTTGICYRMCSVLLHCLHLPGSRGFLWVHGCHYKLTFALAARHTAPRSSTSPSSGCGSLLLALPHQLRATYRGAGKSCPHPTAHRAWRGMNRAFYIHLP